MPDQPSLSKLSARWMLHEMALSMYETTVERLLASPMLATHRERLENLTSSQQGASPVALTRLAAQLDCVSINRDHRGLLKSSLKGHWLIMEALPFSRAVRTSPFERQTLTFRPHLGNDRTFNTSVAIHPSVYWVMIARITSKDALEE